MYVYVFVLSVCVKYVQCSGVCICTVLRYVDFR